MGLILCTLSRLEEQTLHRPDEATPNHHLASLVSVAYLEVLLVALYHLKNPHDMSAGLSQKDQAAGMTINVCFPCLQHFANLPQRFLCGMYGRHLIISRSRFEVRPSDVPLVLEENLSNVHHRSSTYASSMLWTGTYSSQIR